MIITTMNTNIGINMDINMKTDTAEGGSKNFSYTTQQCSIYVLLSKSGPSSNPRALQTPDRFPQMRHTLNGERQTRREKAHRGFKPGGGEERRELGRVRCRQHVAREEPAWKTARIR